MVDRIDHKLVARLDECDQQLFALKQTLAKKDEELGLLRDIAAEARLCFEHDGLINADPAVLLLEALKSASDDLGTLGDASQGDCGAVDGMQFYRAQNRINLAIGLYQYESKFKRPADNKPAAPEQEVAS